MGSNIIFRYDWTIKPQNLCPWLVKASQSNFNLRSPDCYRVRIYLIVECPLMYIKYISGMILTCYIVFQFEPFISGWTIRFEMKEEVVAWRDLARWQGITTIWFSQNGWCIWITIINCQCITVYRITEIFFRYRNI